MELRDPVSSTSHLLTAAWAVFATLVMWRLAARRPGRLFPVLVYGLSMVLLYLASGVFHGQPNKPSTPEGRFFQKIDQSAIYLLIAGSYTPVLSILLRGAWRKWFLQMTWVLAVAGVSCLWLLPKAPHWIMVGLYLSLGWIGYLPVVQYYRALGWRAMNWVWVVAGLYTAGAVCELTRWPQVVPGFGFHEVLHLCDSAASIALFIFVVRHVIPYQPKPVPQATTVTASGGLTLPAPRGTMNAS